MNYSQTPLYLTGAQPLADGLLDGLADLLFVAVVTGAIQMSVTHASQPFSSLISFPLRVILASKAGAPVAHLDRLVDHLPRRSFRRFPGAEADQWHAAAVVEHYEFRRHLTAQKCKRYRGQIACAKREGKLFFAQNPTSAVRENAQIVRIHWKSLARQK